jgi:hypothetical protein
VTLGEKQELFAELLFLKLIPFIYSEGYKIRAGDFFRDERVHGSYGEKVGYASAKSLHKLKLAADLNLTLDGRYLIRTADHADFGRYWLSLDPLCRWGGSNGSDGNHYSFEHDGRW